MEHGMPEAVTLVTPYEGSEDYIFISYSHRDTATVLPLLQRMRDEGYRFWYDEGIDPGSEWPESIAAHLGGCRVCLAFLSASSLASQNCRREINYALSKNKEFLSVFLEPVEMSPGMEMQISSYQSILKYKYPEGEQFLSRLLNLEPLMSCRAPRTAPAEDAPRPAAVPSSAAPEPDAPVTPAEPEQPASRKVRQTRPKAAPPGKKKWLPIAIAAAAVLIVGIVIFSSSAGTDGGKVTIDGAVYQDNRYNQTVTGASLTAEQLRALAGFKQCTALNLEDCTLESGALSELASMEQLNSLTMTNCRGVEGLSALGDLPKLYQLTVSGCGLTDQQIAEFHGTHLTSLDLSGNALTTVPVLPVSEQVTKLDLSENSLESLTSLSHWTKLETLRVDRCGLTSLSGLEGMQTVKYLYAADNRITDLTPLTELIYLSTLDLKNNQVATLAPLLYCGRLSTVSLRNNPDCSDLNVLSGSAGTLTRLDVSGIDLSLGIWYHLGGCVNLTQLFAEGCGLKTCNGLGDFTALTRLSLAGNQIYDISDLAGLTGIRYLNLANNGLFKLPDLGQLGSEAVSPVYVFSNNRLTNLDRLPGINYYGLMLDGNPLTDLSALGTAEGTYLALDCTEITPLEPLKETGFSVLYATSVFIGKQAELESISRFRKAVTPEEAFDLIAGSSLTPEF